MKPKITDMVAWNQAEQLMQPALIRILDRLRQKLDTSAWDSSYEEVEFPVPGYHLCLRSPQHDIRVELWDLCYRVCFCNYHQPALESQESVTVAIDTTLLDETGDVDWQKLDEKATQVVEEVFATLPDIST